MWIFFNPDNFLFSNIFLIFKNIEINFFVLHFLKNYQVQIQNLKKNLKNLKKKKIYFSFQFLRKKIADKYVIKRKLPYHPSQARDDMGFLRADTGDDMAKTM